jgi:hypothetical protein
MNVAYDMEEPESSELQVGHFGKRMAVPQTVKHIVTI